jgi:sarcosine oxidase
MIGQPASQERVYVVAGLSGHGFKMTPALGQILADLALEQDISHWKTDFVSPARFGL